MTLLTMPAVLLRSHAYSESSRILRFYTRDAGVTAVLARGVRRSGGQSGSGLESFAGGVLTLHFRPHRDLQTYRDFTATRPRRRLAANPLRLGGAGVIAELVLRHAGETGNPPLFDRLEGALDRIEAAEGDAVLSCTLSEAWRLVGALGYHPLLDACVHCGGSLPPAGIARFDFPAGGLCCAACGENASGPRVGPGAREQLRTLLCDGAPPPQLTLPRAHLQLASDFVTHHVSGSRPLDSFAFLAGLLGDPHA